MALKATTAALGATKIITACRNEGINIPMPGMIDNNVLREDAPTINAMEATKNNLTSLPITFKIPTNIPKIPKINAVPAPMLEGDNIADIIAIINPA